MPLISLLIWSRMVLAVRQEQPTIVPALGLESICSGGMSSSSERGFITQEFTLAWSSLSF